MATISGWNPFGVSLDITATASTVTRTSATQFTVKLNVSWECYYSGNKTNYGMKVNSGGAEVSLNKEANSAASGSGTLTGTYSISGNGAATKTITVKFTNYKYSDSASKTISLSVSVPALTSYKVTYNANDGSGAPGSQTKWKDQTLKLSTTKPTRTGYTFQGWGTSASDTSVDYAAGANYIANSAANLYAIWKANTYTVTYNANGGSGAPGNQTKTYGTTLTLSSTKPTRTNYTFKGWGTSASATSVAYAAGASYTTNAAITLYAIWELSYVKPRITNVTVVRCDSSKNPTDSGTYALVSFKWATDKTVSSIKVNWSSTSNSGSTTLTASGTGATVTNQLVGGGTLSASVTYSITITVADASGSTTVTKTLRSLKALIHGRPNYDGIAFGKTAELSGYLDNDYMMKQRKDAVFDAKVTVTGKSFFSADTKHDAHIVLANDKNIYGMDGSNTVAALMPVTSSGNTSLGYGFYNAKKGNTHIYGHKVQFYTNEGIYTNDNPIGDSIVLNNDVNIYAKTTGGALKSVFIGQSGSNNVVIGYDNYTGKSGNTNIYGHDIVHFVSNIATPGSYRPYRRRGDTMTIRWPGAGYITATKANLLFFIPFSEPIVGSPTVSVASSEGFILRQNDKYTHGSASGTRVQPDSYSVTTYMHHGIMITAVFSNVTNAVNNSPIGIDWSGTIVFS